MAGRYSTVDDVEFMERASRHGRGRSELGVDFIDSRERELNSALAPVNFMEDYHRTTSRGVGSLVRQPPPPVVEEPVIEHEHHHVHHHIDHGMSPISLPCFPLFISVSDLSPGDINGRLAMARIPAGRPQARRQYSYDDLEVERRRLPDGSVVTQVHHEHDHRRRHRHRHRSRSSRWEKMEARSSRFARSDIDVGRRSGGHQDFDDDYVHEDYTIVDVPPGSRRVYVNIDQSERKMEREIDIDWRREHGVRRSRGLGNELWTEITKDLVCREAIEELGYQYEETDFFYYVFEYLDRDELAELRELTELIRRGTFERSNVLTRRG